MPKQFSAIGAITTLLLGIVGALITAHLHHRVGMNEMLVPTWILWAGEVLAYLSALLIWVPLINPTALVLGLMGMVVFRLLIGTEAALFSTMISSADSYSTLLSHCYSEPLPRICSLIFAILACYPQKGLLPRRHTKAIKTRRHQVSEEVMLPPTGRDSTFLFGVAGQQQSAGPSANSTASFEANPAAGAANVALPEHLVDRSIAIPLGIIAAQLPPGILRQEIMERMSKEPLEVMFPLVFIAPQLREALIQVSIAALLKFMPKGWASMPSAGADEKLTLPLDLVVQQVPEEVLQLSAPAPLPWANLVQEEDKVSFARA